MNQHKASNGVTVYLDSNGNLKFQKSHAVDIYRELEAFWVQAAREFFQAERDEQLGRWRDPENPNVVVYSVPDQDGGYGQVVWVLDEAEMVSRTVLDDRERIRPHYVSETARRYFQAHPEPEPRPPFAAYVDKNGSAVWVTDENGNLRCLSDQNLDPEKYAPFTRLLPDE